jgi:hypothetical protein
MEREMHPFPQADARSYQSDCDHHFLHANVILRHASGAAGEAEEHIDRILTQAAVAKRRVWISSMLFAELRPSMFAPGRFNTFHEFTRYLRSLATLVTPDPNTMLRAGRLRDAKWQRAALWVKEAGGVSDLKFLMFDEWSRNEAKGGARLSLLRLQDYAQDARANSDVMAAVRLTRVQPLRQARPAAPTTPAGQESSSVL